MDEFSVTIMQEMHEGFSNVQEELKNNISKLDEVNLKIKGSIKPISFQNKWAAFWYAIGRGFLIF